MSRFAQIGLVLLLVLVIVSVIELEPTAVAPATPTVLPVDRSAEPVVAVANATTMSATANVATHAEMGAIDAVITTVADTTAADVPTLHLVTDVIDGDTIEVEYFGVLRRVRYIGIDTPETVHPSRPIECFGREAAARNRELVINQWVRLEPDISDTDTYGRLLRYVYVEDIMVNEALVAEGFANVSTYPPDVRHTEEFRGAEAIARAERRGLWGAVCEVVPDASTAAVPSESNENQCLIKGNISQSSGERIYHVPGCAYYEQTVITPAAGEQWFCSELAAVAAGWRKAQNCP